MEGCPLFARHEIILKEPVDQLGELHERPVRDQPVDAQSDFKAHDEAVDGEEEDRTGFVDQRHSETSEETKDNGKNASQGHHSRNND